MYIDLWACDLDTYILLILTLEAFHLQICEDVDALLCCLLPLRLTPEAIILDNSFGSAIKIAPLSVYNATELRAELRARSNTSNS